MLNRTRDDLGKQEQPSCLSGIMGDVGQRYNIYRRKKERELAMSVDDEDEVRSPQATSPSPSKQRSGRINYEESSTSSFHSRFIQKNKRVDIFCVTICEA